MAARTNKRLQDEQTKRRIQASQLLNRLDSFANGKVKMSQAQVMAAKVVIGKSIPDLKVPLEQRLVTKGYARVVLLCARPLIRYVKHASESSSC